MELERRWIGALALGAMLFAAFAELTEFGHSFQLGHAICPSLSRLLSVRLGSVFWRPARANDVIHSVPLPAWPS